MAEKPKRKRKLKSDDTTHNQKKKRGGLPLWRVVFGFIGGTALIAALAYNLIPEENTIVVDPTLTPDTEGLASMPPYDRGVIYLNTGRYLAAAEAFTQALEMSAHNDDAWLGRARAYQGIGDFEAARTDYNHLLTNPGKQGFSAWQGVAELYYEQYERTNETVHLPDALAAAEQAIQIMERERKTDATVYLLAGTVQDELGNAEVALGYYETYLDNVETASPVIVARVAELR